jgi:hypothetical protein
MLSFCRALEAKDYLESSRGPHYRLLAGVAFSPLHAQTTLLCTPHLKNSDLRRLVLRMHLAAETINSRSSCDLHHPALQPIGANGTR